MSMPMPGCRCRDFQMVKKPLFTKNRMCGVAVRSFPFIIINEWRCSAKEAASQKEPHIGTYVMNKYMDLSKEVLYHRFFDV